MVAKGLAVFVAALSLVGCGPEEPSPAAKAARALEDEARAAEARLFDDPSTGASEMKRRFAQYVQRKGTVVVVTNRRLLSPELEEIGGLNETGFMIAAVPATTPWTVKCSKAGLVVVLGASSSGEISDGSGDTGSDLAVSLTNTPLSERQCAELVALVGEDVLNALSGNRK
jgi:hypothetical protein